MFFTFLHEISPGLRGVPGPFNFVHNCGLHSYSTTRIVNGRQQSARARVCSASGGRSGGVAVLESEEPRIDHITVP